MQYVNYNSGKKLLVFFCCLVQIFIAQQVIGVIVNIIILNSLFQKIPVTRICYFTACPEVLGIKSIYIREIRADNEDIRPENSFPCITLEATAISLFVTGMNSPGVVHISNYVWSDEY